jgi:hypothetical protein
VGFTATNKVTIERRFSPREIVVRWIDDVTGEHEKRFDFNDAVGAFMFAAQEFQSLSM